MTKKVLILVWIACGGMMRAEAPNKQIRVIMDTSQSLRGNDPSGYVKLATAMFYDLAWQTLNPRDSFKVLLFEPKWPDWEKTGIAPAVPAKEYQLEPRRGSSDRQEFIDRIRNITYDAKQTYFTPCFQWALDDLRATSSSKDNRVIVLITDGVPDWIEKDGEMLSQLASQLRQEHIQVYVMAFSRDIMTHKGWFAERLGFDRGGVVGKAYENDDPSHLLSDMLEIFSRTFGYSRQGLGSSPAQIDVSSGFTLERAAVVALYQQPGEPAFELGHPSGPAASHVIKVSGKPEPKAKSTPKPVSYAYEWVVPPEKGMYGFHNLGPAPTEVAVLRPIHVEAKIRPHNGVPIDAVMAGKPAPMEVLVYDPTTGGGDPGEDLRVSFNLHYLAQDDTRDPKAYPSEPGPSGNGAGVLTPDGKGRVFVIDPQFDRDPPEARGQRYQGYIEVEVTQFNAPVERMGERMQPVQVYPYVSIRPSPSDAIAKAGENALLNVGDEGCARFQFQGNAGSLKGGNYTLGVRLDPPVPEGGAFRGVRYRMDSKDLGAVQAANPTAWLATESFDPSSLGSQWHTFCVIVGHPAKEERDRTIQVHFGLWQNSTDPYERLNVVDNLALSTSIAAPDFWQGWRSWFVLLISLLLTYLLYLLLRMRQALAPDLMVSLGGGVLGEIVPILSPTRLSEESPWSRWLGLPRDRSVISLAGDKEIGRVRPLGGELFVFMPASGFGAISSEESGEWRRIEPRGDGAWLLSAGRTYRAQGGDQTRFFRVDYSTDRPKV